MNPTSRRIAVVSTCLAPVLLTVACQHRPAGGMNVNMPAMGVPLPSPAAVKMELGNRAGRPVDARRLDVANFIPPGARRVGPRNARALAFAPQNRVKFPSTELAPSPDGTWVLFHDGSRHRGLIVHWLMLLNKTAPAPAGVFNATTAFDASWSVDSQRFVVTNYCGDNSSEVFVKEIQELRQWPIELRALIEEHFPEHVWSSPMFVKAYRWTRDGQLVVRGIGRAQKSPYDEFGCEALVSFAATIPEPRLEFLNGYVLPESAP